MNRILVANWKMNGSFKIFENYINGLQDNYNFEKTDLIIAPPYPYINFVKNLITHANIFIAGQNMTYLPDGARTGEINGRILKDSGANYVILGHSECRNNGSFDNIYAAKTLINAIENDLKVIFCVGEDKISNASDEIVIEQIISGLEGVDKKFSNKIILAYEPVWAIGTGVTPDPEQILHKRNIIKALLQNLDFLETPIIYGGSVTNQNANHFIDSAKLDGFIVGKASMDTHNLKEMLKIL